MTNEEEFAIPDGLSPKAVEACRLIVSMLGPDASSGGGRTFYTPEEWRARGEEYGLNASVIVVHDGGDLAPFMNLDYCCYEQFDRMFDALVGIGVNPEQCTSWYSAIYEEDVR